MNKNSNFRISKLAVKIAEYQQGYLEGRDAMKKEIRDFIIEYFDNDEDSYKYIIKDFDEVFK